MKKLFALSTVLTLLSFAASAQDMARSFSKGDYGNKFTVQTKMTRSCGDYSDLSFIITNHTNSTLNIKLFVEKLDGTWKSLGYENDFESGATTSSSSFWSCKNTGNWVIYYRVTGSDDAFPSESYVQQKYGRTY